jgi:hypothetical protein
MTGPRQGHRTTGGWFPLKRGGQEESANQGMLLDPGCPSNNCRTCFSGKPTGDTASERRLILLAENSRTSGRIIDQKSLGQMLISMF